MHYQEELVLLTPAERATIRRQSVGRIAGVLVIIAGVGGAGLWIKGQLLADSGEAFFWIIFGLLLTVFLGALLYALLGFLRDLRSIHKLVARGTLTTKTSEKRVTGVKHQRSTAHYYYFFFGEKKIDVDISLYDQFEPGQVIEIARTTASHSLIEARVFTGVPPLG